MTQLSEEQQERVKQIRERQKWRANASRQNGRTPESDNTYSDTDFLLSLLDSDSQAGDAERLAFAIESAAVKAGIIEARQHALTGPQLLMLCDDLANAAINPATLMRDECVEKVKTMGQQWQDQRLREKRDLMEHAAMMCGAKAEAAYEITRVLESLTIDQVKPGEM